MMTIEFLRATQCTSIVRPCSISYYWTLFLFIQLNRRMADIKESRMVTVIDMATHDSYAIDTISLVSPYS